MVAQAEAWMGRVDLVEEMVVVVMVAAPVVAVGLEEAAAQAMEEGEVTGVERAVSRAAEGWAAAAMVAVRERDRGARRCRNGGMSP